MRTVRTVVLCAIIASSLAGAQTLPLPERPPAAVNGSKFVEEIRSLPTSQREQMVLDQVLTGNVPGFLRHLCPVTVTNVSDGETNSATFFVTPDYLCVGADEDYFLTPLTPATAQRIADRLNCLLPTSRMVDAIYSAADVKLPPAPIPPSAAMTTVPVFATHNLMVRTQRFAFLEMHPLGSLVAGDKKDLVICPQLVTTSAKVAIYGWHRTNGSPIQPLYLGHSAAYADYSHGVRLVQQSMILNGTTTTVARVLADPKLSSLLSDRGPITNPRYPTNASISLGETEVLSPRSVEFKPTSHFGERVADFAFAPGVRIEVNEPATKDFAPDKPVQLILYALPNGNTIEQTVGRKLKPGDDWHFDIQHIGAQTRFLRALVTNRTVVVAYLEADTKSWPAWRKQRGDSAIPQVVDFVEQLIPTNRLEIVLASHSGGGSFTFGYLNTVQRIPDDIVRIAFLDSDYGYDSARGHPEKLVAWLKSSNEHFLCVIAYNDAVALYKGKTFVSAEGGTWGRSHAMLKDLGRQFHFTSRTNSNGLESYSALEGRIQFLLKENPERKILHTVQVERNGFIHAMLTGTPAENQGYEYFGERAYTQWILSE